MKIKKFLPQIITAILSAIMIVFTFLFVKFPENVKPLSLFEKLGIYSYGKSYGTLNNVFSTNGTHETYVSMLKKTSSNTVFSGVLSFVILAVLTITALIIISKAASKTKYQWTNYVLAVLLPPIFCDFTNTAFFSTLFINPLILVLLLLICAVFLTFYYKNSAGIAGIIIVTAITLIYSWLGVVQSITAIVLGVLIARLCTVSKNKAAKILSLVMGCIVIVQSIAFSFNYKSIDYKQNLYNAVFFGVAKYDSVTELGLDPKLDDFKEVYYGMKENEAEYDLENTFYNKISYKDIAKYYLTHPGKAYKVINYQASLASLYEYDFGFTPYNFIKTKIPVNLILIIIIAGAYVFIAHILGKKYSSLKPVTEFLSGISIMWLISLIAGSIYYGNCDMAMNMLTFSILFDIVILSALIGGLRVVIHRQDEKKEEFGITHE